MYIIAGSTGTLGTAIVDALSKDNELFLVGRDEAKLKEQASDINAKYQVIDLNNTVEPREFGKIIDSGTEIKGLVKLIRRKFPARRIAGDIVQRLNPLVA